MERSNAESKEIESIPELNSAKIMAEKIPRGKSSCSCTVLAGGQTEPDEPAEWYVLI